MQHLLGMNYNIFTQGNPHFYIILALSVLNGAILTLCGYRFLQIIQLTGYKLKGFYSWVRETKFNYVARVFALCLLSYLFLSVSNIVLYAFGASSYFNYIGLIFYFAFAIIFSADMIVLQKKTPLKYTTRMLRLCITLFIFASAVSFGIIALTGTFSKYFRFSYVAWTPALLFALVPFVFYLLQPLELFIKNQYVVRARMKIKTLEKRQSIIKIGITGSFGKTSVKEILKVLLADNYNICAAPASFNTPMGLTKVILGHLDDTHSVLLCEMGARRKGDIQRLCKIVKPDVAVITAIGKQHLATFKTLETIAATKYEMIENMNPKGFSVFGPSAKELYKKTTNEKSLAGSNIKAEKVVTTTEGTSFVLCEGKENYKVTTCLLGRHNIDNILVAVCVARRLGMTLKEVADRVKYIKPIPHRLELIKTQGVTILDDSFNASVTGVQMALNVLKEFKGRKFVMTPGLIELGKEQKNENFVFGESIAKVADYAIVVNNINSKAILEGLKAGGFKEENIFKAVNLFEAKDILKREIKAGDTVLIENDLPDNFI